MIGYGVESPYSCVLHHIAALSKDGHFPCLSPPLRVRQTENSIIFCVHYVKCLNKIYQGGKYEEEQKTHARTHARALQSLDHAY